MSGLFTRFQSAGVTTGTSAKTIAQITAPANTGMAVRGWGISFAGTSPTAGKVLVEIIKAATGGTGTSNAPVKQHGHTGSVQATGKDNFTGEPTGGTVIFAQTVHPQANFQVNDNIILNPGETIAWRTTAPQSETARVSVFMEE